MHIRFGYLANGIPFLAKEDEIKSLLEEMPPSLKDLLKPTATKIIEVPAKCRQSMFTGIMVNGPTPTGRQGYYLEVYRGPLLPFINKPIIQCTGDNDDQLLGCRLRSGSFDWLETILPRVKRFSSERRSNYRIVFILCGNEVIWSAKT